jgi:hypothetical protein
MGGCGPSDIGLRIQWAGVESGLDGFDGFDGFDGPFGNAGRVQRIRWPVPLIWAGDAGFNGFEGLFGDAGLVGPSTGFEVFVRGRRTGSTNSRAQSLELGLNRIQRVVR